jgi:hypothetical protein
MLPLGIRYIPLFLLTILLAVLIWRKSYKKFPWFFSYVTFAVCADCARLITRLVAPLTQNSDLYFLIYWITEAGYATLGTIVLYEVLRFVFRGLTRTRWVRLFLIVAVLATIGVNAGRTYQVTPNFTDHWLAWSLIGETSVRFLQVATFVFLCVLVLIAGLRWRHQAFGIAAGFGLYATVALASSLKFSHFGTKFSFTWGVITLVAYSFAVLTWLGFFIRPEEKPNREPIDPKILLLWLEELRRYKNLFGEIVIDDF